VVESLCSRLAAAGTAALNVENAKAAVPAAAKPGDSNRPFTLGVEKNKMKRFRNTKTLWFLLAGCLAILLGVGVRFGLYRYLVDREPDRTPVDQSNVQAPFVTTAENIVEKMLELAHVKKTDLVYDLGCGDGRIVIVAAKKYGCRAVGIDYDPKCVKLSRENAKKSGVERLVTIRQDDIFNVDFSDADVVTLYLFPGQNEKLIPLLQKLKPGSRIVSHDFRLGTIQPDVSTTARDPEDHQDHFVFLWTTPLRKPEPVRK
jgi:SAM-dependent methyltransferase